MANGKSNNNSTLSVLSLVFGILSNAGVVMTVGGSVLSGICSALPMLSLFFSLISIIGFLLPVSCGVTAIVTGVIQNKREKTPFARAGVTLGIVGISLMVAGILLLIALFTVIVSSYIAVLGLIFMVFAV